MRERILEEIRRMAKARKGQPPGARAFETETGIPEGRWRGNYWARWGDALKEAGFSPNERQTKSEPNFIVEKFIVACRHYKHLPSIMELRMYRRTQDDFPNEKTIWGYFGSKTALIENLRSWVSARSGYDDIVAMLPVSPAEPSLRTPVPDGWVYLIQYGPHYKIGRSDQISRRLKEVKIELPDRADLMHAIRTDDPPGIEAYWHRRFADRKANGEFFKLTKADVAAFKRRKYQ